MQPFVLTVTQLNTYARALLEADAHLQALYLTGEISNAKLHFQSGHLYFSLKDHGGLVRCVMFRARASQLKFEPRDGMKVICRGRISLYERDGQFQFYAEDMQPEGVGAIWVGFEQLKEKLQREGLFDASRKRELPKAPRRLAVITAQTGAAIHDILAVLERRDPSCEVIFCPVQVQGERAARQIVEALERVNRLKGVDLILLGRGGGSNEDLSAFNDETLARSIAASSIPVVSAVGHETDFTICDFVCDARAPTPSAAAELAVPDRASIGERLAAQKKQLFAGLRERFSDYEKQTVRLSKTTLEQRLERLLRERMQNFDRQSDALVKCFERLLTHQSSRLRALAGVLQTLSPLATLARGYAVASKDGRLLTGIGGVSLEDKIDVRMHDGRLQCRVEGVEEGI